MTLLDCLATIEDHRKAKGRRHSILIVLVFIVMGNLAGYHGNGPLARFAQQYGEQIAKRMGFSIKAVPSYSTFRRAYLHLDFDALSCAFASWMSEQIDPDEDCFAIDGKRIRQPLIGSDGKERFVGLVSVFAQSQGITVEMAALSQSNNSELKVVQYLLEKLQLRGVTLSLDAMHAQKNAAANPGEGKRLSRAGEGKPKALAQPA